MNPRKATSDVIEYGRLVIVAMFMIVIVFLVAKSLVGTVPTVVGTIIIGLAFAYIYGMNKGVRDKIDSWARGKR